MRQLKQDVFTALSPKLNICCTNVVLECCTELCCILYNTGVAYNMMVAYRPVKVAAFFFSQCLHLCVCICVFVWPCRRWASPPRRRRRWPSTSVSTAPPSPPTWWATGSTTSLVSARLRGCEAMRRRFLHTAPGRRVECESPLSKLAFSLLSSA